ncbi:MAG: LysM domain-containing protein, partial [Chloroflexota bacterium]
VLETALSTSSGQMQYDAYAILTGIPQTQTACYGMYTQAAVLGLSPQAMVPVIRNTALPNGDVYHEVQYGQTLWSIAIQYGTTIAEIKRLNRLVSDVISPGMRLLVAVGATRPPQDPRTPSPTPVPTRTFPWAVESPGAAAPASPVAADASGSGGEFLRENGFVVVSLIVSFAVLMAGMGVIGKRKAP